jgi:hypothetical protein
VLAATLGVAAAAPAQPTFRGVAFAEACTSRLQPGDAYSCRLRVTNVGEGADPVRVTSLSDRVETAGGTNASGELLPAVRLVLDGDVACEGGGGAGTASDPYVGAVACVLPAGASIETAPFAHTTVLPSDAALPDGRIRSTASLVWSDTSRHLAEASASAVVGTGPAEAGEFHGIAVTEGCESPAAGAAFTCAVHVGNLVDSGHDTLRVTALGDTVVAAGGAEPGGNLLSAATLVFDGPVTCTGGHGAGTAKHPYVGATGCVLPYGSSLAASFSHYTAQPTDVALTALTTIEWSNTCVAGSGDCTTEPHVASADAQALVQPAKGPKGRPGAARSGRQ